MVEDQKGRPLYGIAAEASVAGAADLSVKQVVLSSVRVLRDYQALGTFPAEVATQPAVRNSTITWARDRLDGAAGYRLSIEVTEGTLQGDHLIAASNGRIGLKIIAASGEAPLTPLPEAQLLNTSAEADAAARHALTFLSYQEKFLAGSWRFNTYFGRDTLMSVRLLMRVLTPAAVEAGLGAVLTRLSPQGEVAHEEDIGEFAILDHLRAGEPGSDAPVFDYKMIDGSFMLAPVAAEWLLSDARNRSRSQAFLARTDGRMGGTPRTFGADLAINLRFVLRAAAPFAKDPRAPNLIALKPGLSVGQWRDSNDGLAGGRFAYDVNAVFVPAALEAAGRFFASGLLLPYLDGADRALFSRAGGMATIWRAKAGALFDVSIANAAARRDISRYAAALNISDDAALRSVGGASLRFHALSLSADAPHHTRDSLGRRLRTSLGPSGSGSTGPGGDVADAAVPGRTHDGCRRRGGEPRVCRSSHPVRAHEKRLPRQRDLVLAAGGARGGTRATIAAPRFAAAVAKASADGRDAALARHSPCPRDAQFRALVLEL